MSTDFQIALISDSPYNIGLLKGYCHAYHYKIFTIEIDIASLNMMLREPPNLIILTEGLTQNQVQKYDSLHEVSINNQIPVCYLCDINNASTIEKEVACWVDQVLAPPLDINQLNDYLHRKFKHHHRFIQEQRNCDDRRSTNDRRLSMIEQKNKITGTCQNSHTQKNGATDCFMVGPFQINQRSKSVLMDGKLLNLTRTEFELFNLLAQDIDRVFMSEEIINHVWPKSNRVTKADLYQYMHLIRKKIESDPTNPQWILTVKGFGYKINIIGITSA